MQNLVAGYTRIVEARSEGAEAKTESEDSVQRAALISVLRDEIRRRGTYEVDEG